MSECKTVIFDGNGSQNKVTLYTSLLPKNILNAGFPLNPINGDVHEVKFSNSLTFYRRENEIWVEYIDYPFPVIPTVTPFKYVAIASRIDFSYVIPITASNYEFDEILHNTDTTNEYYEVLPISTKYQSVKILKTGWYRVFYNVTSGHIPDETLSFYGCLTVNNNALHSNSPITNNLEIYPATLLHAGYSNSFTDIAFLSANDVINFKVRTNGAGFPTGILLGVELIKE
jgi:hypothetical protein